MFIRRIMLAIALFAFMGSASFAQYKYIGAKKCGICHKKPATGNQLEKWSNAAHSKAFKSLSSDKAKEYAAKHKIADATKAAECLNCHTTAGSVDKKLQASITVEEGVSCESCHGPGSAYKTMSVMKDHAKSVAKGLVEQSEKVCKQCHDKEKNKFHDMKPFDYKEASAKVAHPNPKK